MKSTMKKAEMAVNRTTQVGQKLADALEVNFNSSSRLHEIGPMLLRSFAHAIGEEDFHSATEKDDPLKGLESEARAVHITLAKAIAEAKEGGLVLIKNSRDLEEALDRFLFASLHHHGVEGDEEEAASASVIGSLLAGCIDIGQALIYAWSWEARLRAWIRRLVSKDQIEMDTELQDILASLATKLQHQQEKGEEEQGNAGMGRIQQASKAIRAMHSCLTSSRSVISVKETDSLPSFFLSIDTPHLLVSPSFGRGQDSEPELVGSDPVERIELYDAGLDHENGIYTMQMMKEGEGICYVHESQSMQIFVASVTRQAPCIVDNTPSSATALSSSRRWYIADVDKKEVYYTAQCSCQHEALPRYGWRVTVQGRAPGPRLRPVLITTSKEAESSGHCHEEASDNRTGLPFTPATVSPEIDEWAQAAVLNANANKELDTSGGSHSSLSSSTSRRRHLVRSARVQQDKEDKPYHDLPRSPSAAPSHHNTSKATESKGKEDGPSSLIGWKSFTIPVFPSIEDYFREDSSRIETKLHRLYDDECKRLAQQADLLKQQLKEQVQQKALNRVKDDAFRQQLEEIGREAAAAKDEEEVKFDALLSLEATMERVLQQQEGLTTTAESELEEGDGHDEEDNEAAEENDDQYEDVDEAMDVVRQEVGDHQDSPSSSPSPSRCPISGTIEVLGIESDLQQEAQQPALFDPARVHYLIRITYVERDSQDATASCQEESEPITSPALIQHRLVVLRKQRSSFIGLHHELQNLVLQASGSGGEPIIKLPEFPDISAADHGKRSSSFDMFSPFSSFTAAGGQRSVTRELRSKLEDYLNALLLCCCLGGKEKETTTTSSTASSSSSSACVVTAAVEKALKDFLHMSEDDDVNQGRRGGYELIVRFHTERAAEITASSRESLLKAQNYRCRGCGSALGTNFLGLDRNYMTCRYLKALFCTAYCSSGKGGEEKDKAVIPGEMIHKWDFSRRRVCRASKLFLMDIGSRPILRLFSLNQDLLGQKQGLKYVRNLRQQLSDLKLVVEKSACPTAQRLLETVLQSRPYLVLDSELFSMDDLIQLHNGLLTDTLTNLVEEMNDHVIEDCTVCKLKGCSHCALCEHSDALFPHQFWKVSQCYACSAIFHKSCLRSKTNQSTSSSSDICPICRQPRHASSSSSSSHRRRASSSFSSSLPHPPQHHQRGVFGDLYIGDGPLLSQKPPGLLSSSFIKTTTVRAEIRREEQQHGAKADDEGQEEGPLPVSFSFDL